MTTATRERGSTAALEAAAPVGLRTPWPWQRKVVLALVVVYAVASTVSFGITNFAPATVLQGISDMRNLIERMFPIAFQDFGEIVRLAVETLFIAYVGTVLAVLLSVPLAFLAARNTTPHPTVMAIARGIIVAARAIPDLVFALIFVRAIGIGGVGAVASGILALGAHSIGMIGKLYADAIEQIDEGPREAVAATGASRLQKLTTGVLPQVMPAFIGTALYRLDINFRTSTVLGYVGAGGIGTLLRIYLSGLRYDLALGITLVVVVLVLAVEFGSASIRQQILGTDAFADRRLSRRLGALLRRQRGTSGDVPEVDAPGPGAAESASLDPWSASARAVREGRLSPPWTAQRRRMVGYVWAALVALVSASLATGVTPLVLVRDLTGILAIATQLVPSSFEVVDRPLIDAMIETISIGVASTTIGLALSLPLAFLAAANVAPARWVYSAARTVVVIVRAVPELIIAVLFVSAVGLGPFPGVLALSLGTLGYATKFFADSIEEVRQGPRDAIHATGATRLQEVGTGVLPQVMPAFVGTAVYVLDINIRASAILGIVGAGGIGFPLIQATRLVRWETVGVILIMIFVVVYSLERLAGWVRKQLL